MNTLRKEGLLCFLALCTSLINAQVQRNLTMTGYDSIGLVYVDSLPATLTNGNIGDLVDTGVLPPYPRLLAVRGIAILNPGCGGILASVTGDFMVSDGSWKCSITGSPGWFSLGFEDLEWASASEIGSNDGTGVGGCPNIKTIPEISSGAKWIWTTPTDDVIYCRAYLPGCSELPCQNGGTCLQNSIELCRCPPGYTGNICEVDVNECASNPCQNGGTCHDGVNGYTCECSRAYSGTNCETDITECASSPCQNGATCIDDGDGAACTCVPGYTGTRCESDIDECESNPCQNGATCEDIIDDYLCYCEPGYSGKDCEINIDECWSNPCRNDATCEDQVNGYVCICLPGHTGTYCEMGTSGCADEPCLNGVCEAIDEIGGFICLCDDGFTGTLCETNIDDCVGEPCNNGGTCTDAVAGFTCECAAYFTGATCANVIPDCGSASHVANSSYPPVNGFQVLCYITGSGDPDSINTPCRNLLVNIPPFNYNSSAILAGGGNFGCYTTRSEPDNSACVNDYAQDRTLGSCLSCNTLSICVRFPNTVPIK